LANDLQARGRFEDAIEHYYKAIDADPQYDLPLFNQALLLATCPNTELRQPDEAVRLAELACEIVSQPDAHRLAILAAAYAEANRFDEAVRTIQRAIQLAEAQQNRTMAEELRRQRRLYENRTPFDSVRH
jgi:tetratricopeptide (TPR) repeat protein